MNPTHDLPNTGQVLHSLSYENLWRARLFNWVHMWQVSCILLLGSALSQSTTAWPILGCVLCFNRCTLTYTRIIQTLTLVHRPPQEACSIEKSCEPGSHRPPRGLVHGPSCRTWWWTTPVNLVHKDYLMDWLQGFLWIPSWSLLQNWFTSSSSLTVLWTPFHGVPLSTWSTWTTLIDWSMDLYQRQLFTWQYQECPQTEYK